MDFIFTPSDWLQLSSYRRGRWSFLVRRVVAIIVLGYGFWHLINSGLDWHFAFYLLLAVFIGIPFIITRIFMSCALVIRRPAIQVSIDDDRISVGSKKSKQDIPWSSFAMYGTAFEYSDHFWLECGRGTVWIPKRAFEMADKMEAFRVFVVGKMGDRCKFKSRQPENAA